MCPFVLRCILASSVMAILSTNFLILFNFPGVYTPLLFHMHVLIIVGLYISYVEPGCSLYPSQSPISTDVLVIVAPSASWIVWKNYFFFTICMMEFHGTITNTEWLRSFLRRSFTIDGPEILI